MFIDPRRQTILAAPAASRWKRAAAQPPVPRACWLASYVRFAPVLWGLGLLQLAAAWLLARAALRQRTSDPGANRVISLWLALGVLQSMASVLNGVLTENTLLGVRNAFSLTAVGWLFAGFGIAMGTGVERTGRADARLFSMLSLYTLVIGSGSLLAIALGVEQTQFGTLVSHLLGDRESVRSGAWVRLAIQEESWGEVVPRLILMYPWPTGLGIGSLGLALISSRTTGWLRWLGIAGGILGVIFSWSRLATFAGVIVLYLLAVMRTRGWLRATLMLAAVAVGLAGLADSDYFPYVRQAWEAVDNARAGSSMARDLIYEKSWNAFLESPVIGHGWVGDSVHPVEHLPIGSHSSVYGTLYTGGLVVFGVFALAMGVTALQLVRALRLARDAETRADREIALCLMFVLSAAAFYESLYSLVIPCFYYFVWIGMSITPRPPATVPATAPAATAPPAAPGAVHSTFIRKPPHATPPA